MDRVAQVASSVSINLEVIKEPRGFIKFIQFIIAIFAFATTCSVSTQSKLVVSCPPNSTRPEETVSITITYPFRLNSDNKFRADPCNLSLPETAHPYGDFSPPSQFYVFVGVMAFLYSLAAVILYICFDDKYRRNDRIPMADFIITVVLAVLWLIASSAWAQGVSDVKLYSDPNEISSQHMNDICSKSRCKSTSTGNFASLNVSLIFGFLNMAVWASNLWFLYKETAWFKVTTRPPNEPTTEPQFDSFGGAYQSSPGGYEDPSKGYQPSESYYQQPNQGYQSRPGPI